jgi:hypothetical protein
MTEFKRFCPVVLAVAWLFLFCPSWSQAEQSSILDSSKDVLLTLGAEVQPNVRLAASDWAKFPRQNVKAQDHDQKVSVFEGVLLADVLKSVGVPFGQQLYRAQRNPVWFKPLSGVHFILALGR